MSSVAPVASGAAANCASSTAPQSSNAAATTAIHISQGDLHLCGAPTQLSSTQVGSLLGVVYLLAGIVAVIVIIIGGVRYATANGDSSQITAAKNTILYAVVGLVVVIMASAITQFVIQQITK